MSAAHDEARIARERAEMEADEPQPRRSHRDRGTGGELVRVDFGAPDIERLRALQAAGGDRYAPTEADRARAAAADDQRALATLRRRRRLTAAGVTCPPAEPDAPGLWTPRKAWLRVTEAATWRDAAHPAGGDSLQAMQALDGWMRRPGVYTCALLGLPGTGKTVSAWWALSQGPGVGVYIRSSAVGPHAEWDALRKRAKDCAGLVVVNDVKAELTAHSLAQIASLVEERHEEGRRTLITSNHPRRDRGKQAGLATMLGDRFVDRFEREGLWVGLAGESLRGRRS